MVYHSRFFLLYYLAYDEAFKAFIASKKVGNAVCRNRCKRLMRSCFSIQEKDFKIKQKGIYIMIGRKDLLMHDFSAINKELIKALNFFNRVAKPC